MVSEVEPPPIAAVARLVAPLLRASVVFAPTYFSFESSLFDFVVDEAAAKINVFYYYFLVVCDLEGDQGP